MQNRPRRSTVEGVMGEELSPTPADPTRGRRITAIFIIIPIRVCVCLIVFLHHSFGAGSSRARCLKPLSSILLGEVFHLRFKSCFPLEDCFRARRALSGPKGFAGPKGPFRPQRSRKIQSPAGFQTKEKKYLFPHSFEVHLARSFLSSCPVLLHCTYVL